MTDVFHVCQVKVITKEPLKPFTLNPAQSTQINFDTPLIQKVCTFRLTFDQTVRQCRVC